MKPLCATQFACYDLVAHPVGVLAAYSFLDEQWDRLRVQWQRYVTIGEARREIQRLHRRHGLD